MPGGAADRAGWAATLGLACGVAWLYVVFVLRLWGLGFDNFDDMMLLSRAAAQTPAEALSTAFLFDCSGYWRPLLTLLTKALLALGGPSALLFHLVQTLLILAAGAGLWVVLGRAGAGPAARVLALAAAAFSPHLRMAQVWWADAGSLINAACLAWVLALLLAQGRDETPWRDAAALGLACLGLMAKELGLVTLGLVGLDLLRRRRWGGLALAAGLGAAYFGVRWQVLGGLGAGAAFRDDSGFWLGHYSPGQLAEMFQGRAWVFYLYNVGVQLANVIAPLAPKGRFALGGPAHWATLAPFVASSALIAGWAAGLRRRLPWLAWLLLAAVVANAAMSYLHVRPRNIPLAGLAWAGLLGLALDWWMARLGRRRLAAAGLALLAGGLWLIQAHVGAEALRRLTQARAVEWVERPSPPTWDGGHIDPALYAQVRARWLR